MAVATTASRICKTQNAGVFTVAVYTLKSTNGKINKRELNSTVRSLNGNTYPRMLFEQ